jgi:UDP-N-acetylmuramoyl-tripeptide--D-alanyl-D-alanine ligase
VLRKKFRTSATLGNLNNHIGVPLTLLDIPADTEIAIVEMGANHQGEIRDLCQIAQPTHGLITNIGKAHLEGFGGLEGVLKGKSELYQDIMSRNGIVFIHSANTELTNLISDYRQVYSYGSKDSDQFIGRSASKGGFAAVEVDGNYFTSQLVGVYNESNILAALAIGSYFHITLEEMTDAITSYTPENNRSQWLPHGKNHYVMDAYNANPSSMQEAIRNFAAMEVHPKTLILGDMLELGTRALEEHKALIRQAGQAGADQVITVGPLFGEADTDHDTMHFLDTDALITYLSKKDFSGMYFLVKGSRRIGLERILV